MNLDRRAIAAVAISILFLVLYRPLLQRSGLARYLEPPRPAVTAKAPGVTGGSRAADTLAMRSDSGAATAAGAPRSLQSASFAPATPAFERAYEIETPLYHARFSNRGARLLSVELKRYASAHGASGRHAHPVRRGDEVPAEDRVVLASDPLFAVDLGSESSLESLGAIVYAVTESTDAAGHIRALTFRAEDAGGLVVRQTYRVRPDNYALDLDVEIRNVPDSLRVTDYSLTTRSWVLLTESNFEADLRALRASSLVGTNIHREHAGALAKGPRKFDGNVQWAAVQNRYFLAGTAVVHANARGVVSSVSRRPLSPAEQAAIGPAARPEQDVAANALIAGLPTSAEPVHHYVLYFGPCEYFRLASLKLQLERAVDMGWTWILPVARLLLQLMNLVYQGVHNYGVAIIVLATLVRVLLHPLNMTSMKSMRAMQRLQPEMERIKEKYKDNPQAMNTAVMALYKENKVNPAGGCLPLVLQMPLFIALYQVLFNAIELRQAPFVAWMTDLSAPDVLFTVGPFPLRLLPILMLGSGILSQRVTPSDPRQLPTMYMMNVVMLVFFYNLPSGLVLYWTVMNLLTALQQWMVLRQDGSVSTATVVADPKPAGKRRRAEAR